jgi:hypothetical protein
VGEFLLVGGAAPLVLLATWAYGQWLGLSEAEYSLSFIMFYAAVVINDPHFAVTYLLFYRNAGKRAGDGVWGPVQRIRYLVAGFVVPLVLAVWAGYSIYSQASELMGLMVQLMFFLVGWHYVKQGFGVLSVLSARSRVRFTDLERRVILTHCFAGWAYAFLHPRDYGTVYEHHGVVYTSLAHPPGAEWAAAAVFWVSVPALVVVLFLKWKREGRLPPWAALTGFFMSIWIWTIYSDIDPLFAYTIPALHSIQYLFFVYLLSRNGARAEFGEGKIRGSVKTRLAVLTVSSIALGWVLFRGAPGFLDDVFVLHDANDPGGYMGIGATPYLCAFVVFVNIHHYFMDHVIWRRDNPETRFLTAR